MLYFSDIASNIPALESIGSKGYNLYRMLHSGIQVPQFFVIPADVVSRWLQPYSSLIATDPDLARSIIDGMCLPDRDLKHIQQAFWRIADSSGYVSVRSSASTEDSASMSFAGQFYTELFVNEESLPDALRKCIASAYNTNVIEYKKLKGLSSHSGSFAVVVQQMVQATRSGIGFSMQPGGNLANMCIVAGFGVGEGVVMEKVETDTYLVGRKNREVQKTVLKKTEQLIFDGTLSLQPVDTNRMLQAALLDEEIQEAGRMLLKTEKLLGCPSDIEFSFDENGTMFVLQMRPITTIKPQAIQILDNTNIVESYPGITLPLSFDFARAAYDKLFKSSANAFWISKEDAEKLTPVFKHLIAHVKGRVYYRLDNWYRMLSLVHRSKSSMQDWEDAVGLRDSEMEQVVRGFRGKFRSVASSVWLIATFRLGNRRFFRHFDRWYPKLRKVNDCKGKPAALWHHYETYTTHLFELWYLTLINDFLAFKSFGWMKAILRGAGAEALTNDLAASDGGVESEEAIVEVLLIKEMIIGSEELSFLFQKPDNVISLCLQENYFPELSKRIFAYLNRFGDRTLSELKLETPSPRSDPELFICMLKQQLQSPVRVSVFLHRKKELREQALKEKKSIFPFWNPRRFLLECYLVLTRYGLKNRENMRFCRTRAYSAVKDIFLEIGRCMINDGYIRTQTDIFYLKLKEVKSYCQRNSGEHLAETIENRKREFEQYESLQLPDRIMYTDKLPEFSSSAIEQHETGNLMRGIGVSPGVVSARAIVIMEPTFDLAVKNRILVSKMTDPGWVFLMSQASALVSEKGSLLSHTAIIGRELGIPVVVNVPGAIGRIQTGDRLTVDGSKGIVSTEQQ